MEVNFTIYKFDDICGYIVQDIVYSEEFGNIKTVKQKIESIDFEKIKKSIGISDNMSIYLDDIYSDYLLIFDDNGNHHKVFGEVPTCLEEMEFPLIREVKNFRFNYDSFENAFDEGYDNLFDVIMSQLENENIIMRKEFIEFLFNYKNSFSIIKNLYEDINIENFDFCYITI